MRHIRFWGRRWLEAMGTVALTAVLMFLLAGLQTSDAGGKGMLIIWLYLIPYYLFIGGFVAVATCILQYYQLYFSVLLSMNCTRRSIVAGIIVTGAAVIAAVTGISALIWQMSPEGIGSPELGMLAILSGCLLAEGGVMMLVGVTVLRWGKIGIIILFLVFMGIGGVGGLLLVLPILGSSNTFLYLQQLSGKMNSYPVLLAGAGAYILTSAFTAAAVQKARVKA